MEAAHRDIKRSDAFAFLLALIGLGYIFYATALFASRTIDGTRYFWLDDDMMISMRYARNLAEGHGLVWNEGDRVEGYTNFLWTLVMALVHLAHASDARAALYVKAIGFALTAANLLLSLRLVRVFAPRSMVAAPLLFVSMLMCPDVVHWAAWGFETPLLTCLCLVFLVRLFTRGKDVAAYAALAAIPLTRADGVYVFATMAAVALFVSRDRRRELGWLLAACVPAVIHLVFRRVYYGDWLPNTYYLKVHGLENVHVRGFYYARGFLVTYALVLILAAGSALAVLRRDRRGVVLFALVLSTLGYVVMTGGDMFFECRFFSHVMPIVIAFATLGLTKVASSSLARAVWGAVLVVACVPLLDPMKRILAPDWNGDPDRQLQVALIIKKNALPTSSVVVLCGGVVPYFTRLRALDMVGKSDRHIARLPPFPGAMIAHGKVDPAYTLGQHPDLVVACSNSVDLAPGLAPGLRSPDPLHTFLASEPFRWRYLPNPIENDYLLRETAVYTHRGSAEFERRKWVNTIDVVPRP